MPDTTAVPINAIFLLDSLVSPERRDAIVNRVLNEFPNLPVAAKNTLRSVVNDEVPPPGGFRRGQAGRALGSSGFLLQEPVSQTVATSRALASAVLHSWSESHSQLKEAVERHLTGRGLTTPGPNLQEKMFRGCWPVDQWEVEREAFTQTYNDEFDQDDVALMMCYVSGNFPETLDTDTDDGAAGSLNEALSASLSRLRELPASAPEWERLIPDFIASVSRLVEEKAAQLRWTEEFDTAIGDIRETCGELLAFFECDTDLWSGARVSDEANSSAALKLAATLKAQLAEYQPAHERAPSIREEMERGKRRAELQLSIMETLVAITALMAGEAGEPGTNQPSAKSEAPALPAEEAKPAASAEIDHTPAPAPPSPAAPRSLPDPQPLDSPVSPPPVASVSPTATAVMSKDDGHSDDLDKLVALQTENTGLRDNEQALRSENRDLREEVETLKSELYSSQEREDSWRLAYRSAMDGSLEDAGVPPPLVGSVLDAVEMAKGRFRQELLFAPNSESSIEDNPFTDPLRVWEALQWLGTTYYASRMGRLRVTDFDQSVKEACGWWYKGDQGETTVSRYEKSYTTRVDGKRYTLVEHIGKGTTFDARYTIRIAFDWDRDKRQVIVGYIGRHQQTDAS